MSKIYTLKTIQRIPVTVQEAWDFFSKPDNLKVLTPPQLGFIILSDQCKEKIYAGQVIEYNVKPLWGISLYWMTEITHVQEKVYFIDEQRFGPYTFWHHQHHFNFIDGGVEMIDIVHYKLPLWFLGDVANSLFVRHQLQQIFDYRFKKVEALFGQWK